MSLSQLLWSPQAGTARCSSQSCVSLSGACMTFYVPHHWHISILHPACCRVVGRGAFAAAETAQGCMISLQSPLGRLRADFPGLLKSPASVSLSQVTGLRAGRAGHHPPLTSLTLLSLGIQFTARANDPKNNKKKKLFSLLGGSGLITCPCVH